MTVDDLIETLRTYSGDSEVVVDDMTNGLLVAPVIRLILAKFEGPDMVLIAWPSQVGDMSSSDNVTIGIMEIELDDDA